MFKKIIAIVMLICFAGVSQAGVTLDVSVYGNSIGQDVYIISATSDNSPITSLGLNATSPNGDLGQVHPAGMYTYLQDFNPFFGIADAEVDQDTQGMFLTPADTLLVVSGAIDTIYELDVNFTGFAHFMTREVLQVVLQPGGQGFALIGLVGGGELMEIMPPVTYGPNGSVLGFPEPASLGLMVVGGLALIRRR